ncbi:hypothetical protein K443DRAFT_133253 [Laccaria amethystina LaAM-08-1]|uniref:Uncharacterized protein n=1 Tax=Laccaria amethystina LaAM-08-1 TaxID=1095629 RepID=A0A0C9XSM3_9AGAR|nr:hypothetical protein K443DRAFT_133253 [Laccaria amethystina LaAM-08-1]
MSSSIPSARNDNLKNKSHSTNNSTSRDLITPLTTRKKGKGVSMTEEAESPMNHSTSEFNTIFWDIEAIKDLPVRAEPITKMTDRMFGVFDPAMDEDVLVPLGAIDRLLPDQTKIKCDCLRSVIELVYKTPKYCHWEHLGTAICKFAAYNLSKNNLVKYTGFEVKYGIEYNLLLEASNYDFTFLWLLASHPSRTEILTTYHVLQHCMTVASKHLVQDINALISYQSTRPSLQSIFRSGSARNEVGKLLTRTEYFDKFPQDLNEIATFLCSQAYKDRKMPKEFTVHRSLGSHEIKKMESNTSRNLMTPLLV